MAGQQHCNRYEVCTCMGFREILSYDFRVADADTIRMGISRESGEAPRTWGASWPGGGRLEQGSLAIPRNVSLSRIDEHQSCEKVPTLWLGTLLEQKVVSLPRKTIRGNGPVSPREQICTLRTPPFVVKETWRPERCSMYAHPCLASFRPRAEKARSPKPLAMCCVPPANKAVPSPQELKVRPGCGMN